MADNYPERAKERRTKAAKATESTFRIPTYMLKRGIGLCVENSLRLAQSAQRSCSKDNASAYSLALYSFAIEEYGKSVLLEGLAEDQGGIAEVPRWIFGFGGKRAHTHERKILVAKKKLPKDCFSFPFSVEVEAAEGYTATVSYRKSSVSIPPDATGEFSDSIDYFDLDLDSRLDALFVDWSPDLSEWKDQPLTDCAKLNVAIGKFIEAVSQVPTYDGEETGK